MALVIDETLKHLRPCWRRRKLARISPPFTPETEGEWAALDLLKYMEYCSDHIESSTRGMRHDLRALCRLGDSVYFFTLNPADTYNPLCSFLSGHDIDLDTVFDKPDATFSNLRSSATPRGQSCCRSPILLAHGWPAAKHIPRYWPPVASRSVWTVWLQGALSPLGIQKKAEVDKQFKARMFAWLDSIFKYEFPDGAPDECSLDANDKNSILRRPPPSLPDFDTIWPVVPF
ncbi:hypothetical protein BDZ89DRAFT_1137908 [Hymenopellis radicata]|nr:hypothetical protein BDZ89DRAFT_1137908 [Hymenopellis radicata]